MAAVSLLTRVLGPPSTLAQWLAADSSTDSLEGTAGAQVALRGNCSAAAPAAQLNTQPPVTLGVPAAPLTAAARGAQPRRGVVLDAQGKAAPAVNITAAVTMRADPVAADGVHVGAVLATSAPSCLLQPQWLSTAGHVRLSPHKLSSGGGGGGGLSRSASHSYLSAAAPELGSTPPQGEHMTDGSTVPPPPALLTLSPWRHSGSPAFLVDPGQVTEAHVPLAAAVAHLQGAPPVRAPARGHVAAQDVQTWRGNNVAAVPPPEVAAPPQLPSPAAPRPLAVVAHAATPPVPVGPSSHHHHAAPLDDSAHGASSWRTASAGLSSPASAADVHMMTPQRKAEHVLGAPPGKGAASHALSSDSKLFGGFEDDLWDPMQAGPEDDLLDAPTAAAAGAVQTEVQYVPRVVRRRASYADDDMEGGMEGGWIHREEGSGEWVEGQGADGAALAAMPQRRTSAGDADDAVW